MTCVIEMGSGHMICLPSFMKIDTGFQAILRCYLCSKNGCNVSTTECKVL
jgi:hypothetical protein